MLIQFEKVREYGITPFGVIHVGMHKAEEYPIYKKACVNNIIFIEANKELAYNCNIDDESCIIVHAAVSDKVEEVEFHITNNSESSSILELGEHAQIYPHIKNVDSVKMKTVTLDTILKKINVFIPSLNILNLDIQGAELKAMKGLTNWDYIEAVFTEVNYKEMYKGCPHISEITAFLAEKGFEKVLEEDTGCGWGDALYVRKNLNSEIKTVRINKKDVANIDLSPLKQFGGSDEALNAKAGVEAYKFYAYISTLINNGHIVEVGTRHGDSALALAYNDSNKVTTFDIFDWKPTIKKDNIEFVIGNFMEHGIDWKNVDIIMIDVDPHDGIKEREFMTFLEDVGWKGILILDDVLDNWPCAIPGANPKAMNEWWNGLPYEKWEVSDVAHYSGTGIVNVGYKYKIEVVNE
jgi:FkbM family methyltransferase